MKKVCLLFFVVALFLSSYAQYVDLGLPSRTKWNSSNESGLYTYERARADYGDKLPTIEQFEELIANCKWIWDGKGFTVKGPNGQSIYMPAAGYHDGKDMYGHVFNKGEVGLYWSSTRRGDDYAYYFRITMGDADVSYDYIARKQMYSVRLVQD